MMTSYNGSASFGVDIDRVDKHNLCTSLDDSSSCSPIWFPTLPLAILQLLVGSDSIRQCGCSIADWNCFGVDRRGEVEVMDVDGSSCSTHPGSDNSAFLPSRRSKALYQFKQQRLPVCKPVLTPASVITTFLVMGFAFIPIGLITLRGSRNAVEIIDRYDAECIPEEFRGNKLSYITDSTVSKNCTRYLKVKKYMKAPIYIYYQLDNYYQNHRRYVKSRSDQQLLHGLTYSHTSSCEPEEFNSGLPIVPCGLIAWSLFNDTFTFFRERNKLRVSRKNIAWESDRDHKIGKNVYPYNFQNGTLIGGAKLDPRIPLSDQEDLIVWMRTAALPSFRKLYGRIEEDLQIGDVVVVNVMNNYNTYSFGGMKKLVLSTSSWLGGRNDFLGVAYLVVGSSSIIISVIFMLLHMKNPRPYGDNSWNKKSISG